MDLNEEFLGEQDGIRRWNVLERKIDLEKALSLNKELSGKNACLRGEENNQYK